MSTVSRSFRPVTLDKDGRCPGAERHFRGAAREVFSYLNLLAQNHGGFVFACLDDIARHTKKWNRAEEPFSYGQCKRVIRAFRALGILGPYCTRTIHDRKYKGWQFVNHEWWTESCAPVCDFKHWEVYDSQGQSFQGNGKQNEPANDPGNEPGNEPSFEPNEPANDPGLRVVMAAKTMKE